eukprot:TRINITY_DN5233_c0_g1_i1.p1 TRINITY_DN5233_c0_g1~~TRINITY_DN5233_c0_g1_i1.p1  ORF type:complete len:215 (+),score=25.46 TRINITY_DN5233_c0_g1_i1:84-728(+)
MALTPLWRVFGLSSKEAAQRASTETIKLEAQNLSSIQDQQPQPLCIYGCASSGKTTLLFHYAVSLAHHDRDGDIDDSKLSKVVLISPTKERLARHKPRQCSLQPKLPKTVLNRIELRYLPNLSELLQYLCCAHMDPESRPAAILVDALDFYTKVWRMDITPYLARKGTGFDVRTKLNWLRSAVCSATHQHCQVPTAAPLVRQHHCKLINICCMG